MLDLQPFVTGSGADQSQLPLVQSLGSLVRSYKLICGWLPFVLGLEELGRGYAVSGTWLLLVLSLGLFSRPYDVS